MGGACLVFGADEERPPNILFILTDDLDKEWINASGAEKIETPSIDRLAETEYAFRDWVR